MAITESSSRTTFRAGSNASGTATSRIRATTPALVFSGGSGTWSDGGAGGTFSPTSGASSTYTPANKTQAVVVASVGAGTYSIQIYGTLPLYPQIGGEIEWDVETKIKKARDLTPYFREDGPAEMGFVYGWANREKIDVQEMRDFWLAHRKVLPFYVIDPEIGNMNLCYFISSIKATLSTAGTWAISAGVKGFYQNVASPF